jgi:GNAT superfamily N-acetyltransferase
MRNTAAGIADKILRKMAAVQGPKVPPIYAYKEPQPIEVQIAGYRRQAQHPGVISVVGLGTGENDRFASIHLMDDNESVTKHGLYPSDMRPHGNLLLLHAADNVAFINGLKVDPQHRGKGYARTLVEAARTAYPKKHIFVYPDPIEGEDVPKEELVKMYEHLGFRPYVHDPRLYHLDPLQK